MILRAFAKHISDAKSQAAATAIALYVYPGQTLAKAAATVEAGVYFMDTFARFDAADIMRQVEWYKTLGLVEKSVDARSVVDLSFK